MVASYDSENHLFEEVNLAWDDQDFLERVTELIAGELSLHEAVDWVVVVEEAERFTVAQWAEIRGVTGDAVRSNINASREKLLAGSD
ncbi:hypothetical protein [Haloarchaeobius amylolyticus]|uniref:hypothetical protein n=1 Tax=Haloarchaeobius amylolyticus TaxID=1198296 RepID=UPI002270D779|nr:hypothetical protein [Haloarchaeobius amylolyticus]